MSKLVAEEGEGCAHGYGVYRIIQDLIEEGKDAKFVDKSGCYLVNWERALECYADYKRKKNPDLNSGGQSRQTLSNGLRSALLSKSYLKDGAIEYRNLRKCNDDNKVVQRQFQMPHKMFRSLFGNAELSDSSEEQDGKKERKKVRKVRKRHLSKVSWQTGLGYDLILYELMSFYYVNQGPFPQSNVNLYSIPVNHARQGYPVNLLLMLGLIMVGRVDKRKQEARHQIVD